MTVRDTFDQRLTAWLMADALECEPDDLLDRVLARTARTRRRPAWQIPERWIPMGTFSAAVAAPRLPWRPIALAALLLLVLLAGVALLAGSQPRSLPTPFGPAANGLVAFSTDGDLYTVDPSSGTTRALIVGPETDIGPVWSLDGTHVVFRRHETRGDRLYVARADGSEPMPITAEPLMGIGSLSVSPDGREVMFTSGTPSKISIAKTDGSGLRTLDLPMPALEPTYRPPNGAQIAFIGIPTSDPEVGGVYVVDADGTDLRTLVEPSRSNTAGYPQWSPDGSLLAYGVADFTVLNWTVQTHIMAADGSGDRTLPAPADAIWNFGAVWSNDGTRLAMQRGYSIFGDSDVVGAVVPVDGGGTGLETDHFAGSPSFVWAPDDTSILMLPDADTFREPLILDPLTGSTRPTTWAPDMTASSTRPTTWAPDMTASWQRLSP